MTNPSVSLPSAPTAVAHPDTFLAALFSAGGLVLVLWGSKTVAHAGEFWAQLGATAAVAFQLYVPLVVLARFRIPPEVLGIHFHGALQFPFYAWRRHRLLVKRKSTTVQQRRRRILDVILAHYGRHVVLDRAGFCAELRLVLKMSVITFLPFVVGHHFFQVGFAAYHGATVTLSWRLPDGMFSIVVVNLLLVALPEELFYRGFVLPSLLARWPNRATLLAIPLGRAVVVSSAIFALGHYIGEFGDPARLGPFFPSLLFSMLAMRSRSIFGAVLYHATCNIFAAILGAWYVMS